MVFIFIETPSRKDLDGRRRLRDKDMLSFILTPAGANMGLLDQHWSLFIIFQCWFAFFSFAGFELAVVCVYTSCQFCSLRHIASLWNKAVTGIAGAINVIRYSTHNLHIV